MSSIAVIGCSMVDLTAYTTHLPKQGETIHGDAFGLGFGGKGANQAVMASRFKLPVSIISYVGDDVFGQSMLDNFEDLNINSDAVGRAQGASGVAMIWVETTGANRIIVLTGANQKLTEQDAVLAVQKDSNLKVVVGQLEIDQKVTAACFAAAKSRGITTILNPAPASKLSPELISNSDWVIPNEVEFEMLHPRGLPPTSDSAIKELGETLQSRLLVTLGELGAALLNVDGTVTRFQAPKVQAIDTVGAGDCFVGSFAFAVASGLTESQSVQLGIETASLSVTLKGAQSSYPTPEVADQILHQVTKIV
jgi:ribokinase